MSSNLSVRLKFLTGLFVAGTLFILFNGWFLGETIRTVDARQQWVEHTYQVINQLEIVQAAIRDAESDQRGYFIRPTIRGLEARNLGIRGIRRNLDPLRVLVTDNPDQVKNVEQLSVLVDQRIAQLDGALEAFGVNRNLKDVAPFFDRGESVMSGIHRVTADMESIERRLLSARTASAASQSTFVYVTLVASVLITVIMIALFFIFFRRHMINQDIETRRRAREAWLKGDEAEVGSIMGGEMDVNAMATKFVDFIARKRKTPAVNVYMESAGKLVLEAGTGPQEASATKHVVGKGLVGQAFMASGISVIEDVPSDFFHFKSAMGERQPSMIAYLPITFRGERLGVAELASFGRLDEDTREWLTQMSEPVGAGFASARSRARLQDLLEETQRQTEELQMQQEELRTSNEELEEQTKALVESQKQTAVQAEELRQVNEELEQQTRALETQQEALNLKNQALESGRRKLEEKALELERASAYKSEFLAKMSHELRTPLNSLMILATLLQENKEGNLNSQQIDFARTIHESGIDLLELINDILDLSKLEARKLAARIEPLDLRSFIEQCASMFARQAEIKGLKLKIDIGEDVPPRLQTDRQRLLQILRNLLSNALKFTDKGEIRIEIKKVPGADRIQIAVADTGVGIPDAKKQLIFEAFEQVDGSSSRKYGGTGLGLTISRELANLLGGQVSVESREGKGSRFALDIPVDLSQAQNESSDAHRTVAEAPPEVFKPANAGEPLDMATEPTDPGADNRDDLDATTVAELKSLGPDSRSILIVEDDDKFRHAVADAARAHGFTPIEAGFGARALSVLRAHVPHAILLDIKLPDISGMTLLERIKATPNLRHVPIHMISALEYQHGALRLGAIGYLGKPVTIDGVRHALSRIENMIDKTVKKLLIVEDDPASRKAITELVGAKGTEVTAVDTGQAAIEILKTGEMDCVILDLKLPDMSGFELLEDIGHRQDISLPPIIVYTGKDLSKDEQDRLRRYSDTIILKGAKSPGRLLDEVNLFLHRMESDLPDDKRSMLASMRTRDKSFEGRQLLLVDDDLRNLFALTSALEGKGFIVTIARDGLEALAKLEANAATDLVLMDIMMPKMDGFEAMRRIRQNPKYKKLPIIALTAKAMKGEQERCIEAGASDYLPKPINLSNLLSVLKVWVPSENVL